MRDRKIFISYCHKDNQIMRRVKKHLERASVAVWTDEGLSPGPPDWQRAVEREIEACQGMIVLLSPDSCRSEWVRREISRARKLDKVIIPVVIKEISTPITPLMLENTQYISVVSDFYVGMSQMLAEFEKRGWVSASDKAYQAEQAFLIAGETVETRRGWVELQTGAPQWLWPVLSVVYSCVLRSSY